MESKLENQMKETVALIIANKYTGKARYQVLAYLWDIQLDQAEYFWNRITSRKVA